MNLNNLVKAAIFSSTAIGLGFVFMFIPNLEFISVTVFLSGLTLGGYIGAIVGGTSMLGFLIACVVVVAVLLKKGYNIKS